MQESKLSHSKKRVSWRNEPWLDIRDEPQYKTEPKAKIIYIFHTYKHFRPYSEFVFQSILDSIYRQGYFLSFPK